MSKYPAWALLPLLMIGIWGTSFSVCQGLMADRSPAQFLPESCDDYVCQQMCLLVAVDSPAFSPKVDSLVLEVTGPSSLPVTRYDFAAPSSSTGAQIFNLQLRPLSAPGEVYLLNATFLI